MLRKSPVSNACTAIFKNDGFSKGSLEELSKRLLILAPSLLILPPSSSVNMERKDGNVKLCRLFAVKSKLDTRASKYVKNWGFLIALSLTK